jgi:nucleotide-binding universal stress UspA family protein
MVCAHVCPISQIKTILLATDGSQYSEGAVREAIAFARKCESRLEALSVIETAPGYESGSMNAIEKEEAEVKKHLASVKQRAAQEGVAAETYIHEGEEPHQMIVDEAAAKKADMLIIGRRGRKGIAKLLMGEVASQVIGHAPCKVLVVPRAARIAFKTLLVATDGSAHSNAAVDQAIGIAKCSGSTLIALSAARDESEMKEAQRLTAVVADRGAKEGVAVETATPIGRSFDSIVETAGGRGVDLIIMGIPGKTGIRRALAGSATEKVIGSAGCAVLVI